MNKNPKQAAVILAHLEKNSWITALEALNLYGCFRLAARIHELKELGYNIQSERWKTPGGANISKYTLKSQG